MRRALFLLLSLLLLSAASSASAAPATTYVDIEDQAYHDLDKLVAFGLCGPTIQDQRPYLRGEFARLVAQARKSWEARRDLGADERDFVRFSRSLSRRRYIDRIVERMTEQFREELIEIGALEGERALVRGHPAYELRVDAIYASSAPLTIIPDNGYGWINAKVNPLLNYREGRHAIDGFQTSFEIPNRFTFGRFFAVAFTPRVETDSWRDGDALIRPYLQEGYGVLQAGDAALTFGRAGMVWGPSDRGSMMFSNNARPLDMVQFQTPTPFRLPWVFRYLGQWKVTMMGANMGPESSHPYWWLTGWRVALMPARYVEIGFGHVAMMGGENSPPLSAIDVIGEYFGFRPGGSDPSSPNKSNHDMEASLIVRIPQLWGAMLYGSIINEDKRDTVKRFLRDGSSYLAGVYLPRLTPSGSSDLRLEFRRLCAIQYRHGIWNDGYTLNQLVVGDNLGPDALGFRAAYSQEFSDAFRIGASFDWEKRRSDIHGDSGDPDGTLGDIIILEHRPAEERYRAVLSPRLKLRKTVKLDLDFGYERVLNAGYVQGVSRNNWLAAVTLRLDLDRHFRFEVR